MQTPAPVAKLLSEAERNKAMDYAWQYFALHSGQRISMFNFFLVLSGGISTGVAGCLTGARSLAGVGVALGVLLVVVAFAFWKLDQRTSMLIKHAEDALAALEPQLPGDGARLFLSERQSRAAAPQPSSWSRIWTYGEVFRTVYLVMAMVGLSADVLFVSRALGWITW